MLTVGAARQRVVVEQDQVGRVPDRDRAPAVRRRGERLAGGERLLGGATARARRRSGGRRGDRQPRVERGDRCVGAEHHVDAVVEHPAQREAALGTTGPQPLGDVAVVEQVGGLDARADAEPRPSGVRRRGW